MAPERQPDIRLTGIHIDLVDRVVTLDAEDGRKAKLLFGEPRQDAGLFPESPPDTPDQLTDADDIEGIWAETDLPSPALGQPNQHAVPTESPEKQQTTSITGKLKTQPKAGRPDRQGRPTAWARLTVHADDSGQDHVYSATFHRAAVPIALKLARGANISVEGYVHPSDPAGAQQDRLSIIAVHNYPGKAAPTPGREDA